MPDVRFDLIGEGVAPIYDLGADYHQDGWASYAESLGTYVEIRSAENCISERTELRRPLYSGRRNLCTLLRTASKTNDSVSLDGLRWGASRHGLGVVPSS